VKGRDHLEYLRVDGRITVKVRDNLEYLGVDGRIILRVVLVKWDGRMWIGFIWLRMWTGNWL
jgi:hypothetical protein